MKDAYEVLYQKEADLARVRREIDSLTIAANLLGDQQSDSEESAGPSTQDRKPAQSVTSPDLPATSANEPFVWPRRGFWSALRLRR